MRIATILVLAFVLVIQVRATECSIYSEEHTTGNTGGFSGYIYIAAPAGASISEFLAQARKPDPDLNTYPWTTCTTGQPCQLQGPGSGTVSFPAITRYDFPTPVWSEPNVTRAYIGTFQSGVAAEFRFAIKYSWNKPYCEALAWNRMSPGHGWPVIRLMVPGGVKIAGFGARVRDGDNGKPWLECPTNGSACPPPLSEIKYDKFQPVQDASHSMQGYETGTLNQNGSLVRNGEVWIQYAPHQQITPNRPVK